MQTISRFSDFFPLHILCLALEMHKVKWPQKPTECKLGCWYILTRHSEAIGRGFEQQRFLQKHFLSRLPFLWPIIYTIHCLGGTRITSFALSVPQIKKKLARALNLSTLFLKNVLFLTLCTFAHKQIQSKFEPQKANCAGFPVPKSGSVLEQVTQNCIECKLGCQHILNKILRSSTRALNLNTLFLQNH